jgi:hypothetical protein
MGDGRVWTVVFWGAVLLAACGGSAGSIGGPVGQRCSGTLYSGPGSETHVDESDNGTCGAPRAVLTGTKNPGEPCRTVTDCMPTCCACAAGVDASAGAGGGAGSKVAWVALCRNGLCASADDTCCTFEAETPAPTACR